MMVGRFLLFLGMIAGIVLSFTIAPAKQFPAPDLARFLFYHLPCAIGSAVFLTAGPVCALQYLRTQDVRWDRRALAMLEMAAVLGALTLLTGMLFAKVQWGTWWNWDPRQTSYLLVELMLLAYLVLRASITDPDKKATHSAAYILVAVLPMLFLVFVYPRLPQVLSLHPNLLRDGGLDASYRTGYLTMQFTILALCGWIVTLRIQQQNVRAWIELQAYGKLANRDRAAHPRVVRVVSLPVEGGPESQERS